MNKIFFSILIIHLVSYNKVISQTTLYFDSGRGNQYERDVAILALSCISNSCYFQLATKNHLDKSFKITHELEKKLELILKPIQKVSWRNKKNLGYYQVDNESKLVFTRSFCFDNNPEIFAQIELKLVYSAGFIQIKYFKVRDKIKKYDKWKRYLSYSYPLHNQFDVETNIPEQSEPIKLSELQRPHIPVQEIFSDPKLCSCYKVTNIQKIDDSYFDYYGRPLKYNHLTRIGEHSIIATSNNKKGIIDFENNVISPLIHQDMQPIGLGDKLKIKFNNKFGLLDEEGKTIISPIYEEMKYIRILYDYNSTYSDALIVRQNNKYGVLDVNGSELILLKYQSIRLILSKYFIVSKNNLFGVIDLEGNEVFPLIYDEMKLNRIITLDTSKHR